MVRFDSWVVSSIDTSIGMPNIFVYTNTICGVSVWSLPC
jgi:hypothetical protein